MRLPPKFLSFKSDAYVEMGEEKAIFSFQYNVGVPFSWKRKGMGKINKGLSTFHL
jgi:hypothetical protein